MVITLRFVVETTQADMANEGKKVDIGRWCSGSQHGREMRQSRWNDGLTLGTKERGRRCDVASCDMQDMRDSTTVSVRCDSLTITCQD